MRRKDLETENETLNPQKILEIPKKTFVKSKKKLKNLGFANNPKKKY